jgi:acyl carrier protein
MTDEELKTVILDTMTEIAPEIDAATVDPSANFREQFDFDSMDFLNFVIALHERLNVEIPEADYRELISVDGAVNYLRARLPVARA